MRTQGGAMLMIDCDVENGGMKINKDFIIDFKRYYRTICKLYKNN
jgi:selenium-binding protein 1